MPSPQRTRRVTKAQARSYAGKAEEFLAAAQSELGEKRPIAATSLTIHAAINAADAVCGARLGKRSAASDHEQVLPLLREAGTEGTELAKEVRRLLPLKAKAEYEPEHVPLSQARKAVARAEKCVVVARRAAAR